MPDSSEPVTQLLAAAQNGDGPAREKLWSLIYNEVHDLARRQMAQEGRKQTLQPTLLVHEAYVRLMGDSSIEWASRRHFFVAAAKAMRQIRIDYARKRKSLKRGGGQKALPLEDDLAAFDEDPAEVLAVHDALDKLERKDPRKAEVVMLRHFAGLTVEAVADALGIATRTVENDWRLARAWLHRELAGGETYLGET